MAEPPVQDAFGEARSRADAALTSSPWSSLLIAVPAWFGGMFATAGTVGTLVQAQMIDGRQAWAALTAAASIIFPVVYGAFEIRRLLDRSEALKDLLRSQRQWEILIRDARDERDELRSRNTKLEVLVASQQLIAKAQSAPSAKSESEIGVNGD